jgi:hypothetical protein
MELKTKAKEKETSLSNFVSEALREHMHDSLPKDHIKKCFGSIKDETFALPEDRPRSWDAKRETL